MFPVIICASLSLQSCLTLLFATPWIVAHQAPLSMELSRQIYYIYIYIYIYSGLPFPPPDSSHHRMNQNQN